MELRHNKKEYMTDEDRTRAVENKFNLLDRLETQINGRELNRQSKTIVCVMKNVST